MAAVVFLYKAGVLMPDLAAAFGELRNSYNPTYVSADSLDPNYNAMSYDYAASGGNYAPVYYGQQQNYRPAYGARPSICYTSHMPIVNGVNYNYPIICNDPPSYSVPGESYPAPAVSPTNYPAPNYPAYYQYPSYTPQYVVPTQPPRVSNPRICY